MTISQAAFQPLYPEDRASGPLKDLAAELIRESYRLAGQAGATLTKALRPKLRAMNSYYTNKIEGQHTYPSDIERAMRHEFDANQSMARKQRIAIAHMNAEESLEARCTQYSIAELYRPDWVATIHRQLYATLPQADQLTNEGDPIGPGEFRSVNVTAGRHAAPEHEAVLPLMAAWFSAYAGLPSGESQLIGIACAHHRLLWIHPFRDGNGRAARLHAHLALHAMELTQGLWSPMRGLARNHELYYAKLNNADLPRRNDLDGRGTLSQEELVNFAGFFLGQCLDQVRFMRTLLDLRTFRDRLTDLLIYLQHNPWPMGNGSSVIKPQALEPLHYAALSGPLERGQFIRMMGLGERTGRRVLSSLLAYGLLSAPSHVAPVSFSITLPSLRFIFPRLWPEAET